MIDRPEGGERVVLVHLLLRNASEEQEPQEFYDLSLAAGATVISSLVVNRTRQDAKYCIGTGKVAELEALVAAQKIDLVLFDCILTPTQERNLERAIHCRVLDRTGLILDIFAKRARTYEGKLQVEMAQLKHHSTRLIRGWTHLERQKGGIGLRGPGETQLEVDRRLIKSRIKHLEERLEKVRLQRDQGRRARQKASLPMVSLVGYTNAGKSTLFNALTGSEVLVADQLFATLDPTLRTLEIPSLGKVVFADTVGFIRQLPHGLVEAFRATLEETKEADLLLHVIDSQDELRMDHIKQVEGVLEEIGALAVPRIEVYNKVDLALESVPQLQYNANGEVERVFLSAKTGMGISLLKEAIIARLSRNLLQGEVTLSSHHSRQRAALFAMGIVIKEREDPNGGWVIQVRVPESYWNRLCSEIPELKTNWKASTNKG